MLSTYVIIGLCLLIVVSYLFNLISKYLRIPSVLLLLATGVLCKWLSALYGMNLPVPTPLISVFGTVGLILIVLEGTLDITFAGERAGLLGKALLVSIFLIALSSFGLAWLIRYFSACSFHSALLYGIALSLVSSAIVIPTVQNLGKKTKEFMLYESTITDILGILFFNVILNSNDGTTMYDYLNTGWELLLMFILSIIFSILLAWFMGKIKTKVRFYLVLALIILLYETGELFHVSSLLLIMCFGLVLNNMDLMDKFLLKSSALFIKRIQPGILSLNKGVYASIDGFKPLVDETAFVIRTFFFFLFGYSIQLSGILEPSVLEISGYILLLVYSLRLVTLSVFARKNIYPEILIFPRGLTTILLYYNIPAANKIAGLNDSVLFTITIITNLLMMFGVIFYQSQRDPFGKNKPE
jgi:Kef-type K+ transport system membrane component KefB